VAVKVTKSKINDGAISKNIFHKKYTVDVEIFLGYEKYTILSILGAMLLCCYAKCLHHIVSAALLYHNIGTFRTVMKDFLQKYPKAILI